MIAFDPRRTVEFTFEHYKGLPEAERPVFIARVLTVRDSERLYDLLEQASNAARMPEQMTLSAQAALVGLVGWRNVRSASGEPIELSVDGLKAVLTTEEMASLPVEVLKASRLSGADRKNSGSPSASVPAASAEAAQVPGGVSA